MINSNFIKPELWRIWIFIFIALLHVYLIYTSIHDYLKLKALSLDPLYGGNWKPGPMNFQLSCLLCSITLLPIILLSSLIATDNLSNDGHVLGKDMDNNHFIFDSDEKGHLIRIDVHKSFSDNNVLFCGVQATFKQQFLPISIFLQIISGFCYLLPLPFIEAQKIQYGIHTTNYLWHTDLDFLMDPDRDHHDFTNKGRYNFQLPMRPAYFNMIFCLCQLTFCYPTVFWRSNRKYSLLFCIILIFLSLHILVDYSSTSILIRMALNPEHISHALVPTLSPITICMMSLGGSFILLLMQMSLFNYGLNQYFTSLARHRQNLRLQFKIEQNKKSSDPEGSSDVSSETMDINDNNSSDSRDCDCQCSKYISHVIAIIFGVLGMSMKTSLFMQNSNIFSKTGDRIMYLNLVLAISFSAIWLIIWFGLSLHNTWQFKVNFTPNKNQHANINHVVSVGGITSSTLPIPTSNLPPMVTALSDHSSPIYATCNPAGITLVRRNFTPNHKKKSFDSGEDTDLSSCHNYVLLHNANTNKGIGSPGKQAITTFESLLRQGIIKTQTTSSPFMKTDQGQIINVDDSFGSEKSSGSNFSRSLTIQDKGRYNLLTHEASDAPIRHFVNRYYSMEHPNVRKEQRLNMGRSPLLSYQFSTESSPSESQNRRTILDPLTSRVSFKDEVIAVSDSKNDYITNKQFDISDITPSIDKIRAALLRAESQHIDMGNANTDFSGNNSIARQNGFNENTVIIMDKTNNQTLNISNLERNVEEEILEIPLNFGNMNNYEENNSEDERLCSQV